jgi:hypothetical protein
VQTTDIEHSSAERRQDSQFVALGASVARTTEKPAQLTLMEHRAWMMRASEFAWLWRANFSPARDSDETYAAGEKTLGLESLVALVASIG